MSWQYSVSSASKPTNQDTGIRVSTQKSFIILDSDHIDWIGQFFSWTHFDQSDVLDLVYAFKY